jgi:hypothetical protein
MQLPPAIGAYANLFKPYKVKGSDGEPKYSVVLLYPKADAAKVLAPLIVAAKEVARETFGQDKGEAILKNQRYPLLGDGDAPNREGKPRFPGMIYIRASSTRAPGVAGIVNGQKALVFEESEAYSGATFVAAVAVFGYDKGGQLGVSVGLNNILVTKKGPRMDGRKSAEDEFANYKVEPEPSASGGGSVSDLL